MNINYLIELLTNRLSSLTLAKDQAFSAGDLERINKVDAEILDVKNTLSKLELLASIEKTALSTPFSELDIVKNGIETSLELNSPLINFNGDATGVLLGYDISSYATDPLHEEKIADILNYIGDMDLPSKIDEYINTEAIGSPVTGAMIYNSAQKYNVDVRLMMAIMELDSRFGTAGIAVNTLNPGNVGNNDEGETRTYPSWDEGVEAVAKWLDNHRVEMPMLIEEEIVPDKKETVEVITEVDENGDVITTTTTTTEEIIPIEESQIITPEPEVVPTTTDTSEGVEETVSSIRQRRKRA